MNPLAPSEKSSLTIPRSAAVVVWICSFSSVASLLLHLPGIISMKNATLFITIPSAIIIGTIAHHHWRSQDAKSQEFIHRLKLGFIGGLIGTIGYDLARVPFHYAGMNPLSPIQAYGMWVTGSVQADLFSHLVGFLYHLSNGITFGWIYSLLMIRRSWIWAVFWALLLETLAILSPFGSVFALRSYSGAVTLAYVAHLFYGIPLGIICQQKISFSKHKGLVRPGTASLLAATAALTSWFVADAHAWGNRPKNTPDAIVINKSGISPAWSNYRVNSHINLRNERETAVTVLTRTSGGSIEPQVHEIPAGESIPIILSGTGIYQFGVSSANFRSVFISVHEKGDYRLPSKARDSVSSSANSNPPPAGKSAPAGSRYSHNSKARLLAVCRTWARGGIFKFLDSALSSG